eukprot:GHVP01040342.1.p1 GENE.GHVP01040342.1~~GHVP01040342.1.p1  ORF type:complete len:1023 (-),score=146.71 GHVP01040342.1:4534-7572(-)
MQAVTEALQKLHNPATADSLRRELDVWLRNWQESVGAWVTAHEMLSTSAEMEVQIFAAMTLRFKIVYDFSELPQEDRGRLLQSLLGHLKTYAAPTHRRIMHTLCLALLILSVQMADSWNDPVETVLEQFGKNPETESVFIEFVRTLPSDAGMRDIITDSKNKHLHSNMLSRSAPIVLKWLDDRFKQIAEDEKDPDLLNNILETFVAWLRWARHESDHNLMYHMAERCFKLSQADDHQIVENSSDCLVEIFKACRYYPFSFSQLLTYCINQMSNDLAKNTIKRMEAEDWQNVNAMARLYHAGGRHVIVPFVYLGKEEPQLQIIMDLIFKLTLVPYVPDDPDRGPGGISSYMLELWWKLIDAGADVKIELENTSNDTNKYRSMSQAMNLVYETFIKMLDFFLQTCAIPVQMRQETTYDAWRDFETYRDDFSQVILDSTEILGTSVILDRIFSRIGANSSEESVEASFYVLEKILKFEISKTPMDQPRIQHTLSFLTTLSKFAPETPPRGTVGISSRIQVFSIIKELAKLGVLEINPELIPSIIKSAMQNVQFDVNVIPGGGCQLDEEFSGHLSLLNVSYSAASCLRTIFEVSAKLPSFQQIEKETLVNLYTNLRGLKETPFIDILEGLSYSIGFLASDVDFLTALEHLCNPLVACICDPATKQTELLCALGRLASILKSVKVSEPDGSVGSTPRSRSVAVFVQQRLWPMMRSTMSTSYKDGAVIERAGRILKHSMRCVKKDFKPVVPDLAEFLLSATEKSFQSTYLYAAEWLVTEFYDDHEVLNTLSDLFEKLTSFGYRTLTTQTAVKSVNQLQNLVEDYFGIFCRYQRFARMIPASSSTLQPTLKILPQCLHVNDRETINVVFGFLDNIVSQCHHTEPGETFSPKAIPFLEKMENFMRPLLLQNLPAIIKEIIILITSQPTESTENYCINSLEGIVHHLERSSFESIIAGALCNVSKKIITTEDELQMFVADLTDSPSKKVPDNSDLSSVARAVKELSKRSRQIAMRAQQPAV